MNLNIERTSPSLRWNGAMPLLMSFVVIGMIVADLLRHGFHAPHHDEGTADHIAILLMFGQLPIMASLALSGWREWPRTRPVLTLQVALWGLTYALSFL
nr:hypothetical protein [Dyella sp. ASV24]